MTQKLKGFTLIELIVVIGIIAILAAIVIVAVNPARQFAQARNTTRRSDVNAVLNAIHQAAADANGTILSGIPACTGTPEDIAGSTFGSTNLLSLSAAADEVGEPLIPTYISALPADPQPGTGGNYTVCSGANNRLTVAAPAAELGATVTVTR